VSPRKRAADARLGRSTLPLQAPKGMGDLLPPEASARRALTRRVLRTFARSGYELVIPPVIELADVVQRGSDGLESRDLLRFVEPESGEVVVLRPDITPQVARMVATRLGDHPLPMRLAYEGRVFRRQHGRARNHSQIAQAGVEHIGNAGLDADTEVVALAIEACEEAGLEDFRVELTDIRLVRSLLEDVPAGARTQVSEIVAQKDAASLRALAKQSALDARLAEDLCELLTCYGEPEVLDVAKRRFRSRAAQLAIANLQAIVSELERMGCGARIVLDLAETRGLTYYSGLRFNVLATGPGEAIGAGGRYDGLLARFGLDAPAVGFALDLGHLQATLGDSARRKLEPAELRVVVASADSQKARDVAMQLRRAEVATAVIPLESRARCLAFARAWGYDAVLFATKSVVDVVRVNAKSAPRSLSNVDIVTLQRLASGSGARTGKRKR
jgi:ATP phosphoribosyltransferase regulatory subunit